MKFIYLIRHAKSSWNIPNLDDFNRPLNKRGIENAKLMGKKLTELNCNPDYIISSSAIRTAETSAILSKATGYNFNKLVFTNALYETNLNEMIQIINKLPNHTKEVILISHNPTITKLSNYLTDDYIDHIPTCGIVKIELEIENWQHIIEGIGRKIFFIYPKMF